MSIAASNSIDKLPYVVDRVKAETYNTALMKFFKMRFLNISRQPRPQSAFPWLLRRGAPPPKPGKSALGTRLTFPGFLNHAKDLLQAP